MTTLHINIVFLESVLGTAPNNDNLYRDFIAAKMEPYSAEKENAEVAALPEAEDPDKGMTVFPRTEDGKPFLYDYQIKGFFKDACGMLSRLTGKDPNTGRKAKAVNESGKLTAYKKVIDGLIFVQPRKIVLNFDGEIGICQRPLRAQTAQGERVALAMSEEIPAGAQCRFDVVCLDDSHANAVREWLDYGALRGIGQWRNSRKGAFAWMELDDEGAVIGGDWGKYLEPVKEDKVKDE